MKNLYLLATLSSFFASLALMPVLIGMAYRFGITDNPDGSLKRHKQPTPYLGGLGVGLPVLFLALFFLPLTRQVVALLCGCAWLLVLGLIDDLIDVRPRFKIIGHGVAAGCFVAGGIVLSHTWVPSLVSVPLSVLWLLTVINAFNLIDVMDGLTGLIALVAAGGCATFAILLGQSPVALLALLLAGAVSGFLLFNRPPARIYLGDCGSLFVGGFFAAMPLLIDWQGAQQHGVLALPALLAVPLIEVLTLIVVRRYHGIPFYRGSPHHFAHYLQRKGWRPIKILLFVGFVCNVATVLAGLFLFNYIPVIYWPLCGISCAIVWLSIVMK